MEKNGKVALTTLLSIICVIVGLVIIIIIFSPIPDNCISSIKANTHIDNSNVENVSYTVKFTTGNITIKDSLALTDGFLNGNAIINSTINTNSTITLESKLGSICIYGDTILTLENIYEPRLYLFAFDSSYLTIKNCTFSMIYIRNQANLTVFNSTFGAITDYPPETSPYGHIYDIPYYSTSISIYNNSFMTSLSLQSGGNVSIINSSIKYMWISEMGYIKPSQRNFSINIQNSTHSLVYFSGCAIISIYGTSISNLNVKDMSRVTLNQSICNSLSHGIIVYGNISINNQVITGSDYVNNTNIISSSVSTEFFDQIAANNSANVSITNTPCHLSVYDNANVSVNNVSSTLSYYFNLYGHGKLTFNNVSFNQGIISTFENSSMNVLKNSILLQVRIYSSGRNYIHNSTITQVMSSPSNFGININDINIINSTSSLVFCYGSCNMTIENCTITTLFEGIVFASETIILNNTGIFGTGYSFNKTSLKNNAITTRILKLIEVINSTTVTILDNFDEILVVASDTSHLTMQNTTYFSINAYNFSKVILFNCSDISSTASLVAEGNSEITIEQNCIFNYCSMLVKEDSKLLIRNSNVSGITLCDSAYIELNQTNVTWTVIAGNNYPNFSIEVINSTINVLHTRSWGLN